MPTCNDCGEDRWFRYEVEGNEIWLHYPDDSVDVIDSETTATSGPTCDVCNSTNVTNDQ